MNELKQDVLAYILDHVVLPLKLPLSSEKLAAVSDRFAFLCVLDETVDEMCAENRLFGGSVEIRRVVQLIKTWRRLQYDDAGRSSRIDERVLHKSICSLKNNESLALYMPTQNACILLTRSSGSSSFPAVVSYFQVSHANEKIMTRGDDTLESIVPDASFRVPSLDVLSAPCFAQLLVDLSSSFETTATSVKHGYMQTEVRDVSSPILLADWLMHALASTERMCGVSEEPLKIKKKVRDDVLWANCLLPFRRSPMWTSIKSVLHLELCTRFGERNGLVIYKTIIVRVLENLCHITYKMNSDDLNKQMVRKLARRLYKLHKLTECSGDTLADLGLNELIDSKRMVFLNKKKHDHFCISLL